MTTSNPSNLIVGDKVTIANVSVAGYNGNFTVTAIPCGTTFQYTAATGLAAGTGGTAAADTSECGMVDQGAALIPNDGGKVLLAGGDLVTFLGQASNLSFIFDPATQTFSRTTGSLAAQRELFALVAMDPAVVTGPLSGEVVAFGGIDANSRLMHREQFAGRRDYAQHRRSVRPEYADLERGGQHYGRQAGGGGDIVRGRRPCG